MARISNKRTKIHVEILKRTSKFQENTYNIKNSVRGTD